MKTIKVTDWNNDKLVLKKDEYIRKFTEKMEHLNILVNYDDASEKVEEDGTRYYLESQSEEQFSEVVNTVFKMASNEFDRLHSLQKKVA